MAQFNFGPAKSQTGVLKENEKGVANGVAELDSTGKVPSSQLPPSYTLPLAANGTRGGVQIGFTQSGKNYPVQLSSEKMYVNVPWTDHYAWSDITDKPATATRWPTWDEVTGKPGSFYTLPLAANGTRGGVQVGYTQSGQNYPVQLSGEKMYVNVPWTDESGNNRVLKAGDTMTGDLTLYAEEGNSPSLIFQRGNDVGSLTDWKIFVQSGWLKFCKRDNTTSGAWTEISQIDGNGIFSGSIDWTHINNKPATATRWPAWSEVTDKPGLSSLINSDLSVGSSLSELNDYLISQSAGGGGTDTTYYRRTVANVVNGTVVKNALGTNATHGGAYLRKDGTWQVPSGTYSLPLAANGTRGGVQVGYTQSGKNYPVQLSGEKMYVNVPWTDESGNNRVLRSGDTMTGDLTLYAESGNSPSIVFLRGTTSDNYTDWKIQDISGYLYFHKRDNTTGGSWSEVAHITDQGLYTGAAAVATNANYATSAGTASTATTANTAATANIAGAIGDLSSRANLSDLPLVSRVSWGTSVASARSAVHHIVFVNQDMGSVWCAGTNDIQVTIRNRDNNQWISYQSSSGSVNVSCAGFTAKRTDGSSSNKITITMNNSANASISIVSL